MKLSRRRGRGNIHGCRSISMSVYTNISAAWSDIWSQAPGCDCHRYKQINFPVGRCGAKIQFLNLNILCVTEKGLIRGLIDR